MKYLSKYANLLYYGFYSKIDSGSILDYSLLKFYLFIKETENAASIKIGPDEKLFLNDAAMQLLLKLIESVIENGKYTEKDGAKDNLRSNPPVVVHAKRIGKYYLFNVNRALETNSFHLTSCEDKKPHVPEDPFTVYSEKNTEHLQGLSDITPTELSDLEKCEIRSAYNDSTTKIKYAQGYCFAIKDSWGITGKSVVEISRKAIRHLYDMKIGQSAKPLVIEKEQGITHATWRYVIVWNGEQYIVQSSRCYHGNEVRGDEEYVLDECPDTNVRFGENLQSLNIAPSPVTQLPSEPITHLSPEPQSASATQGPNVRCL